MLFWSAVVWKWDVVSLCVICRGLVYRLQGDDEIGKKTSVISNRVFKRHGIVVSIQTPS